MFLCKKIFYRERAKTRKSRKPIKIINVYECDNCLTWYERPSVHPKSKNNFTYCSSQCYGNHIKSGMPGREKIELDCLEKHGVKCNLSLPDVREKIKNTCMEKYGGTSPFASSEVCAKIAATSIEKYGHPNASSSEVIKEKRKQTFLDRYGVAYAAQIEGVAEKMRQTCLENYGVPHPQQSEIVRQKTENTCLEKYGAKTILGSKLHRDLGKITLMQNYGVEHPMHSDEIKSRLDYSEIARKSIETKKKNGTMYSSLPEGELYAWLCLVFGENDIIRQVWFEGKSVDFYVKSLRLFIEEDGVYWHSLQEAKTRDKIINDAMTKRRKKLFRLTDVQWKNVQEKNAHDELERQIRETKNLSLFDFEPGYLIL